MNTGATSLASFSSRGPVTVDGSNRIKPDIVGSREPARRSNTSDKAYCVVLSGTSMAGPHVVGVVALLWSGASRRCPRYRGDEGAAEQHRQPERHRRERNAVRRHRPRAEQPFRLWPHRRARRLQRRRWTTASATTTPASAAPATAASAATTGAVGDRGAASAGPLRRTGRRRRQLRVRLRRLLVHGRQYVEHGLQVRRFSRHVVDARRDAAA